jgi:BirA family biotin operon repressor/biotin-[acetyl-CoA-carboxylase] ligase
MAQPGTQSNLLEDYHLLSYDVLDSTNEEAKRLAGGGASHGAVIWTKRQTAGKGRMGREWMSPEGNLYVSVLLQPPCSLAECSQLSFVTALAVAETIMPIVADESAVSVKWPNDILHNGRKLGGILLESFTTPMEHDQEPLQWVVIGVGLNIDSSPADDKVAFPATCLRESGVEIISAKIVLSRFIYNFIHCYDQWTAEGFDPVRKRWHDLAWRLGHPTDVLMGDQLYQGAFQGIDELGRLLLQQGDGKLKAITAGDVMFKEG